MPIDNNAVFTAAKGYIFTATTGTAAPTPTAIDTYLPGGTLASWTDIGHTSREDLPEFGFDGGDSEVRGTWQTEALKSVVTEAAVDYVTFKVHQFNETNLELFYGATNSSATVGVFGVANASTTAIEKALLIIVIDGGTNIGFYAPKAAIRRDESIELATDEFAAMPLRATFLKHNTADLFQWISLDIAVNPT